MTRANDGAETTRRRMRRVLAGVVTLALLSLAFVAVAPRSEAVGETITFAVQADASMSGATWLLTTYGDVAEDQPIDLGIGTVPAEGTLSIDVPLASLAASTSLQFVFRALLPLDRDHGLLATASVGLIPAAVVGGATVDLGQAVVTETPINEASLAQPTTPVGTVDPGTVPQVHAATPGLPTLARPPTLTSALPAPALSDVTHSTAGVQQPPEPMVPCRFRTTCDDDPRPSTGGGNPDNNKPRCSGTWYNTHDCVLKAVNYSGVLAFRGFGQRPVGAFDTFKVEFASVHRWDNGIRVSSGPFRVDGRTLRQYTTSQTDTFPERGDCWTTSPPGDRNCNTATDGAEGNYGRDTWRWEKHQVWICSQQATYCNYYIEERLRELSYDGGTEPTMGWPGRSSYYARPSMVQQGAYGPWAAYFPGGKFDFHLVNELANSNGATLTVNPAEGFGTVEFTSTWTNKTMNKIANQLEFRRDLPWMGKWFRYDDQPGSDAPWQTEYWSCQWAAGYGEGGSSCWSTAN